VFATLKHEGVVQVRGLAEVPFEYSGETEDGRICVSHKVVEARGFVKKWSIKKTAIYSIDDMAIVDEMKRQLTAGNQLMVIAREEAFEYDFTQLDGRRG
jgi:hypothetical protein